MTAQDRSKGQPPAPGLAAVLLDHIDCGIAACDAEGRLLLANGVARRELDARQALCLDEGRVRCLGEAALDFDDALREAAERRRSRLLWAGGAAGRLMVALMPVHADAQQPPCALLMLGRRSLCSPLGLELLALRHGLTLTERRVLRQLIEDRPARAIAAEHGVALSTVRTQIQSIRHKLGVRNIDALLLRAAQVPPLNAAHALR